MIRTQKNKMTLPKYIHTNGPTRTVTLPTSSNLPPPPPTILSFNCAGIQTLHNRRNKLQSLKQTISQHSPNVILLQETHTNTNNLPHQLPPAALFNHPESITLSTHKWNHSLEVKRITSKISHRWTFYTNVHQENLSRFD